MQVAAAATDAYTQNGLMPPDFLEHAICAHGHIKAAANTVWQLAVAQRRPQAFKLRNLLEEAGTALMGHASYATLSAEVTKVTVEMLQQMVKNVKIMAEGASMTHQQVVEAMGMIGRG